jgi:hypothetical protein
VRANDPLRAVLLVGALPFWLICLPREFGRSFHDDKIDCGCRSCGAFCGCILVPRFCGKACKNEQTGDRRVRPAERALRVRLRSIQLVHGLYLPERQVDASAILALLSA